MYNRPYNDQPAYHNFGYYNYPYSQQSYHFNTPYNGSAVHQTPYEHFAKPQQPMNWPDFMQSNQSNQSNQNHFNPPPNTNPGNSFINYFQDKDGQVDLDKMLSTVGQLANTYHQVSPIVKQFGSIMKNFR